VAFEAGGVKRGAITNDVFPQAIEARATAAGPLPETFRANGGRCCPHSSSPKFQTGAAFVKSGERSAPANGSVDEAAQPDIHHQANRQENKQRGRTPVAHQRQRDAGDRHSADHHSHVYQNMEA
jgi:hypothetical protein